MGAAAQADTSHRILVVDDDETLLRLLRVTLMTEGFDVETAQDGIEGLAQIDRDGFDLLVIDLQMTNMDGRELFRALRSKGYDRPVLFLSAYGAEEARTELNAEAAMSKPFDSDELISRIRS